MSTTIRFKRGDESAIDAHLLQAGEPAFSLDTHHLWVGDGTADGGCHIGPTSMEDITPTSTKGDILVDDGLTVRRLPVGLDGEILTADSTSELGIKWTTP